MGVKGNRNNEIKDPIIKLTEATIQESLKNILSQPRFLLKNLYVFGWESDLLLLTKSGYWYEYEIKISRADFKNDFKHKNDKHVKVLQNLEHKWKPNYFYYAVPENMISINEVPEYAGLIYVSENGSNKMVKQAPKLHTEKVDPNKLGLVDKFYYNMVNAKIDAKNSKYHYRKLEEKYSDMADVEKLNHSIGFNKAIRLAEEAYIKSCQHYLQGENSWARIKCLKNSTSSDSFSYGRCKGNCEELGKFLDNLNEIKENGYQN